MRSAPFTTILEEQIRDLQNSNAQLKGQISSLQVE